MERFTLRQLQIFAAVAKRDNLAAAGRELRLSQATMSEALRNLEALLGQSLFDRSNRRLVLNAAGRAFLNDAQQLLAQCDTVFRQHFGRARLMCGASVTVGNYILPPLLIALSQRHPELQVELVIRNTEGIAQMVLNRDIEAAIVEGKVIHHKLETIDWREDELAVFAAPDHPLAAGASEAALAEANWILRESGSGTRESFDDAAEDWPSPPKVVMTAGGNEIIKRAVAAGLGIGCLSKAAVERELARGEIVLVPTPLRMYRTLTFIRRVDNVHDPYMMELARMLDIDLGGP